MGLVENISYENFPRQSKIVGQPVRVCFHYDSKHTLSGICIRDDLESPHMQIFQLEDGRVVLATECQVSYDHSLKLDGYVPDWAKKE